MLFCRFGVLLRLCKLPPDDIPGALRPIKGKLYLWKEEMMMTMRAASTVRS